MGLEPTTVITGEPTLSFTYDPKKSLYEQFYKAQGGYQGEGKLEAAVRRADELAADDGSSDKASSAIIRLRRSFSTPSLPPLTFPNTSCPPLAPLNWQPRRLFG